MLIDKYVILCNVCLLLTLAECLVFNLAECSIHIMFILRIDLLQVLEKHADTCQAGGADQGPLIFIR